MAQGYRVGMPDRLVTTGDGGLVPAVGWKVTTYVGGTTTPLTTYSDAQLMSANTNPIISDADGFIRCFVAAGVIVKFSTTDENDVPQAVYSVDYQEAMVDPTGADPVNTSVKTGTITGWCSATPPDGYLLCDGSLVSRVTYADLFAVMGITFGAGNGSTTVQLPDYRGRFMLGVAVSGTGSVPGGTGGAIDHTHTGPSHTHTTTVPRTGWTPTASPVIPATSGALSVGNVAGAGQFSSQYESTVDQTITSSASGTGNTGTANAPFQAAWFIIKT
jgi:microcystin-dependent protein